ncbi:superoxide dismutase family protein [Kitasatospora sp. NBC_01539]|uniref:superoxide dismutase family protein n=1 Tax=Kitasatospora sp. NBC_01539 TaxID=2903577 RepID=UPI00386016B5
MPVPFAPALPALLLLPALAAPATVVDADFDPASAFVRPTAISHVPDLVPYGGHVRLTVTRAPGASTVALELRGLAPSLDLAAHVHTGRCGADPAASGPHYQHVPDPVQPSTDPAYANDRNEVRLALRTDDTGQAAARTAVGFAFRPGEAHSLVLHTGRRSGAHPAGERIACVDVDL